jgi:hypothetical protein
MADNVGVYDVYGAVMSSPGPRSFFRNSRRPDDMSKSGLASSSMPGIGTVIVETKALHHEVTHLNAFFSATERFESGSNIIFSYSGSEYGSWAEKNLYYSKSTSRQYASQSWTPTGFDYLKSINVISVVSSTVGITDNTSSNPDDYAVLTYLSGAVANYLWDEYGIVNPDWFLQGNGFGTPYIPDSSMSLGLTGSAEQIDAAANKEIINISVGIPPQIPGQNDLVSYLSRLGYAMDAATAAELALKPTTASTYFPLP